LKISRVRLEQVRKFKSPFELANLDPGLNVFVGPNEAGKSTVVGAIRAAFFERYKSGAGGTKWLRPWGESDAAPTIEVDFTVGSTAYKLRKTFLKKSRCELLVGSVLKDGDAAEDQLAELLGYSFSAKGESKPEHQGVPGLLWIDQGQAQVIQQPVESAADYLRQALDSSASAVATSHSDAIIVSLKDRRDALLTETGRHRGDLAAAESEAESTKSMLADLDAKIGQYRNQIDRLAKLASEEGEERKQDVRSGLAAEVLAAEQRSRKLEQQEQDLDRQQKALQLLDKRIELLDQTLKSLADQDVNLQTRKDAVASAETAVTDAEAAVLEAKQQQAGVQARFDQASAAVTRAAEEERRVSLIKQRDDAAGQIEKLAELVNSAKAKALEIKTLQEQRPAREIVSKDVEAARKLQDAHALLQAQQTAQATRLRFDLTVAGRVKIEGVAVENGQERLVTGAVAVQIENVGQVTVTPGAASLDELKTKVTAAAERLRAALKQLGVDSLADAEATLAASNQLRNTEALANAELKGLAPWGIEKLTEDLAEATRNHDAAVLSIGELSPAPTETALPVRTAQSALDAVDVEMKTATKRVQESATREIQARTGRELAAKERDAAAAIVTAPERIARQNEASSQRVELNSQRSQVALSVEAAQRTLELEQPQAARQDVTRLRASLEAFDRAADQRQTEIGQLRARLEGMAGQGLEEESARLGAALEVCERRLTDLARLAKALDLLVRRLQEQQNLQKRRLQAPLRAKVQHYLPLVMAGAELG
jgi:DNA repair exonuclease SbcCD ATPase subunit